MVGNLFKGLSKCVHIPIIDHSEISVGMLTIFMIVYGMLSVKEYTGNAWGCVFIFVLLWNAF